MTRGALRMTPDLGDKNKCVSICVARTSIGEGLGALPWSYEAKGTHDDNYGLCPTISAGRSSLSRRFWSGLHNSQRQRRRRCGERDDGRPRSRCRADSRLRRRFSHVEAAGDRACAALHGHRARPSGDRQLGDSHGRVEYEQRREARARYGACAGISAGERRGARHRPDGRLCVRRNLSSRSAAARADGRVPTRRYRMARDLRQSQSLALSLSRAGAARACKRPRTNVLRLLLERLRGQSQPLALARRSRSVRRGLLAARTHDGRLGVLRFLSADGRRLRAPGDYEAADARALDRRR
jgi:hypothetical protein